MTNKHHERGGDEQASNRFAADWLGQDLRQRAEDYTTILSTKDGIVPKGIMRRSGAFLASLILILSAGVTLLFQRASAASNSWTSDQDFLQSGSIFNGIEVIGNGAAARLDLMKDRLDWKNAAPPASPGAREGAGLVFSTQGNVSLLFGGSDGNDLDDTWEYDASANTWTEITTSPRPPGREWPAFSYDPVQKVAVLFGGLNITDGFLDDTWEFDFVTGTWSETSPSLSPPLFADSRGAYYASAPRHIVVGQALATGAIETWSYDAGLDEWTNLNPANGPSSRSGFAIGYHEPRDRLVLFGGSQFVTLLGDTWEYEFGGSWVQIDTSGPSPRSAHAMTYRSSSKEILLFGGLTGSGASQETWRYTEGQSWLSVESVTKPPPRRDAALAYDPKNDVAVLFGGSVSGFRFGDTWTLGSAYRAAGKYTSAVFDGGGATVVWERIWWNRTPPNQPANTDVLFQLATADIPNPPTWDFVGIGGSSFTYYESPGWPIWTGHSGHRYLRFLGDLRSTNPQATPSLEDLTITFVIPPEPPRILMTDPQHTALEVPLNKTLHVVFTEAMDLSSLQVTFVQGPAVTLLPTWTNGDSEVDLVHAQPFEENLVYEILVAARDLEGNDLVEGPVPNPWVFVTEKIFPHVLNANPAPNAVGVPATQSIFVNFTEPMNASSVSWRIVPFVDLIPVWSNANVSLELQHLEAFRPGTYYTIELFGTDLAGLPLTLGPMANPWTFAVGTEYPYIESTSPPDLATLVPPTASVTVVFSEPMNTSTVTFSIEPNVSGQSFVWSGADTVLTMSHTGPFVSCTIYAVTVAGRDANQGLPLIPNPLQPIVANPWKFAPACDYPFLVAVRPMANATNVDPVQNIIVVFSSGMDNPTVQLEVTGGPYREMSRTWSLGVQLIIQHVPFVQCHRYTIEVSGSDGAGHPLVPGFAPNPWSFDILCEAPFVTSTSPADGTFRVPLDAHLIVHFNEPMDPTNMFAATLPGIALDATWSDENRTLTLSHEEDFANCTSYQAFVDGVDLDGNSLLTGADAPAAPDPWAFTTWCPGFYIVRTDPAANETSVPRDRRIVVEFSNPADIPTFQLTLSPSLPLTRAWTNDNTTVTLTHEMPFPECTAHRVTVSANDTFGNPLKNVTGSKANPWTFETACVPPQVLATDPRHGAPDVGLAAPIIVTFSEAMDPMTVTWSVVPPPSFSFSPRWTNGYTVLTLNHTTPFEPITVYTVTITGRDTANLSLSPGPVPNPWSFSTPNLAAPAGLHVARGLTDVALTWNRTEGATGYIVFSAESRLAPWPWPVIGNTSATMFVHPGASADGLTHNYIVRAVDPSGVQGANSTMGVKASLTFHYDLSRTNVHWMSLPYRSIYRTASDLSDELTSSRIDVVGEWNPETQDTNLWYYFRGAWRGTNFALDPGDGFFVGIVDDFEWVVNGTDREVGREFTHHPPPNANVHWISLPYTMSYSKASDLVLNIEGSLGADANTKIVEVARWDPLLQRLVLFSWSPAGWGGTDFTLVIGEGLSLRVVSSFGWTPRLVTPEVP